MYLHLTLHTGLFFNSSSRFSVPKWKTSSNQQKLLFQEIFHIKSPSLVGRVFSFWDWKWRGRVKIVFFCFHLVLISNANFQVTLSKETGCEKKIHFVWSILFPLHAQKFLSRKISSNTVQLNLSPNCLLQLVRKRKTNTKETNWWRRMSHGTLEK